MKKKTIQKNKSEMDADFPFDPRREEAWKNYITKGGTTFGNAYLSAIKADYSKGHAKQITSEKWWLDKARKSGLLAKAEKVLDEDLELETVVDVIGMFGPIINKETKKPFRKVDPDLRRIRQSAAGFVASRLGKNKGYSARTEVTGKDGEKLPTPIYGGLSGNK